MAELINLRTVRKQAKRRQEEKRGDANRAIHAQPTQARRLEAARHKKAARDLDGHRIEPGDRR